RAETQSLKASRAAALAAIGAAALSLFLVYDHTREDSLSADEPIHILSGYFAVASRSAIVNIEHPPLIKALSGLAVTLLPLGPPSGQGPDANPPHPPESRLLPRHLGFPGPDRRRRPRSAAPASGRAPRPGLSRREAAVGRPRGPPRRRPPRLRPQPAGPRGSG